MDTIKLSENQLIDCVSLAKITIGDHEGLWANEEDTVILASGEVCLRIDAHKINDEYYHEVEFDEYDIVYDHYRDRYELSNNCCSGYINSSERGHFSLDAPYISYGEDLYMSDAVAEEFGIHYCCDCEINYHTDYGCDCNKYCFEYHDEQRDDWSNGSEYKIGLEIEKEDLELKEKDFADDLLSDTGWIKESDGSLDRKSGFELVSPILPFMIKEPVFLQNELCDAINSVANYLSADYSDRCGGHINISKQNTTSEELLKSISGYLPLFYAMYAKRVDNRYSEAMSLTKYIDDGQKHYAFFCKNNGILEFRIFPAVKNLNNLLWRIEFLRLILANPTPNHARVLLQITNRNTLLYKHLRLIFDDNEIVSKIKSFCFYLGKYDNVEISLKTQQRLINKILKVA